MKKSFITLMISLFVILPVVSNAGEVIFAWDANTEEDLLGYKIYWGKMSRHDESVLATIEEKRQAQCAKEENPGDCVENLKSLCAGDEQDPACHAMLFSYDNSVDVENYTTFTLKGLEDGQFYATATAYDKDGNESMFSEQLAFRIDQTAPSIVLNFAGKKKRSMWQVTVEEVFQ